MTEEETRKNNDDAFMDDVYSDGRLDSGTDTSAVNSDLDFINMTGLTAPSSACIPDPAPAEYNDDDLDPEAPVSFYEEGVDDVDSGMDPANASLLDDEVLGRELPAASSPKPRQSSSLAGLQEIISELSRTDEAPAAEAPNPEPANAPESLPEIEMPSAEAKTPGSDVASVLDSIDPAVFDEIEIPVEAVEDDTEIDVDVDDLVSQVNTADLLEEIEVVPADTDDMDVSDLISSINFEEAESLLNELENRTKDEPLPAEVEPESELHVDLAQLSTTPPPVYNEPPSEHPEPEAVAIPTIDLSYVADASQTEADASIYSKPQLPGTPLRHRRHRSPANSLGQLTIILALLAGLGLALYYGYGELRTQNMGPRQAYDDGMVLFDEGKYEQAADHFLDVARKYANDPVGPDAEFMAGYSLFVYPESSGSKARDMYTRSRGHLETFLDRYPQHEKAARAETMIAMLLFKTGQDQAAIEILDDPDRRLRDPDGYLPSMRTLGRAYARQMDYAKAEIALMRAASLDENLAPDQDYLELAAMFNDLGSREDSAALATEYLGKAVEHWSRAAKSPATIASKRRELSVLIEYTEGRIAELSGSAAPTPTDAPEPEPEALPDEIDFDSLRLPEDTP